MKYFNTEMHTNRFIGSEQEEKLELEAINILGIYSSIFEKLKNLENEQNDKIGRVLYFYACISGFGFFGFSILAILLIMSMRSTMQRTTEFKIKISKINANQASYFLNRLKYVKANYESLCKMNNKKDF